MSVKSSVAISSGGKSKIGSSKGDRVYYAIVYTLLIVLLICVMYPLIYVVSSSFSSPKAVSTGRVIFFPVDVSVEGYKAVFEHPDIFRSYGNTIFYTVVGTCINLAMTMVAAYALARQSLPGRKIITFLFTFTMIFSGGMIPGYILMTKLNLINTRAALIIPGAISVYNLIVTRSFIETNIPHDLLEASQIDGCTDFRYFFSVVLPLSKAIIAVMVLFYAVGHWNAYFNAFLYLNKRELFPLQIVLREILISQTIDISLIEDPEVAAAKQGMAELLKYSLIIVATVPVMCLYPFVQKYFVKGVMIGSIKG